jgi:ATP-dependent helicase HrpB
LDPELKGINVIIFDEFHERGIDSDVALALCKQTQQLWRKDLQIVVMSATLLGSSKPRANKNDGDSLSPAAKLVRALGGTEHCDIVRSDGRQYPITVYHSSDLKWSQQARPLPLRVLQKDRKELVNVMCDVIEQGIKRAPAKGDVLAFLPGGAEIRRTVQQLSGILPSDIEVVPLYGALSKEDQDYALFPKSGDNRRVIVSSPIAEASLTLERVTCVVDSGLRREPRCDVDTNMPRLVTTICSKASATQRAGRAGRVQEGLCLRIYTESEFEDSMAEDGDPEILSTDLCPTTLLLVDWGCSNQEEILHEIPFVDPPPKESLETAIRLLTELGALRDEDNRLSITKLGQKVAAIPTHPRIATVLQTARERNNPSALAAAVAVAFLLDDDTSIGALNSGPNLVERVTGLYRRTIDAESSLLKKSFLRYAARIGEDAKSAAAGVIQGETPLAEVAAAIGPALLPGFIDLIGERKGDASYGASTYLLSLGRSARLDNYGASNVEIPPYVVVVETSTGDDGKVRIRAFAAIAKEVLMEWSTECEIAFSVPSRGHEVRARRVRRIGSLELDSTPLPSPSPEKVTEILKETINSLGDFDRALTQTMGPEERAKVENLFQRVRLAAKLTRDDDKSWPSVFLSPDNPDDEGNEGAWGALVEPWLAAAGSLKKVDLLTILQSSLSPEQQYQLDKDFPTMIQAPDGSQIPVSYSTDPPSATAKLQQFFGTSESPRVGPTHRPISVSLSLLSPAGKVVAQTIDLSFFWSETYPQVRAELRGRYAKHPWPEDPINAKATRQTKKQMDAAAIIPNMSEKESSSGSQKKRSKRR